MMYCYISPNLFWWRNVSFTSCMAWGWILIFAWVKYSFKEIREFLRGCLTFAFVLKYSKSNRMKWWKKHNVDVWIVWLVTVLKCIAPFSECITQAVIWWHLCCGGAFKGDATTLRVFTVLRVLHNTVKHTKTLSENPSQSSKTAKLVNVC